MNNRYKEAMDEIFLSQTSKKRILTAVEKRRKSKDVTKYLSVAACLLIILSLPVFLKEPPEELSQQRPQGVLSANPMEEVNSPEELSQKVGFQLLKLEEIPFEAKEIKYFSVNGTMAQTIFAGDENVLILRESKEEKNISEDFNEYSEIFQKDGITLKGSEKDSFLLALFEKDGLFISLKVNRGLSQEDFFNMISKIS